MVQVTAGWPVICGVIQDRMSCGGCFYFVLSVQRAGTGQSIGFWGRWQGTRSEERTSLDNPSLVMTMLVGDGRLPLSASSLKQPWAAPCHSKTLTKIVHSIPALYSAYWRISYMVVPLANSPAPPLATPAYLRPGWAPFMPLPLLRMDMRSLRQAETRCATEPMSCLGWRM